MKAGHSKYHPAWYRRKMPIFWWLRQISYTRFITRELTSLAVGYSALVLLLQLWSIARGPETYDRFVNWLQLRPVLSLHILVLGALVYHSVTWLNLAPRALVLRWAGRRLPDTVVLVMHYAAWFVASAAVAWLFLAG